MEMGSFYDFNDSNDFCRLSRPKTKDKYNILDRRTKEFLV